ncbi:MAG TPA: amino acid permease [Vicinamibacterales bacterium]|nr:amino acid permease [Vicinamibacterales bacterium]
MGRGLGLWSTTALVIGHTIGVGVFLTPAEVIGAVASPALTLGLWLGCGALVLAGAFTFGELASRYPLAGGPYVYLREAWGERIAFLYGWQSLLVMDPGVIAALATGLSSYAVVLWPPAAGAERWLAVAVIWLLAIVGAAGLTPSARVLGILTACKVAALVGVVVIALAAGRGRWSHFEPFVARHASGVPLGEALALGLVAVFFSFGGFWEASRVAGEVRDARRTLPAALVLGIASVTGLYVATTVAFIYLVPPRQAASAPAFAQAAGEALLGRAGPSSLALVVLLSAAASLLALLIMAPRLYLAMSGDRLFPAALARRHPATGSPARATLLLALLASLFAWAGTFRGIVAFFMCTTLAFIALAAAALIRVRRRHPDHAGFSAPGHPLTTVLFVLLVAGVVTLVAVNRPLEAATGFAAVLLGVPAHAVLAGRRAVEEPTSAR